MMLPGSGGRRGKTGAATHIAKMSVGAHRDEEEREAAVRSFCALAARQRKEWSEERWLKLKELDEKYNITGAGYKWKRKRKKSWRNGTGEK